MARGARDAAGAVHRTHFQVDLGCCGDEAATLGEVARGLPGVRSVDWSPSSGLLVIDHDDRITDQGLHRAARRHGVTLRPVAKSQSAAWWTQPRFQMLGGAVALFLTGWLLGLGHLATAARVFYYAAVAVGLVAPAQSAWSSLRRLRLTIATLLVVAVAGALLLGLDRQAAMLTVVFSLGETLEGYVSDRARGSIRKLMALAPPTARRRAGEVEVETPVAQLQPGDVVVVRPGERLPTDGTVVAGLSSIDQSAVTGEALPVEVGEQAEVFGGTLNGLGALDIRVSKRYADTTLARIIRQVEQAQAAKGSGQRFADRFGAVYTPAMFTLALLVAVLPPLLGAPERGWLYRSLVLLVVSCSCGLVMSVPAAVVASVSRAARSGILIKGGAYLEALGRLRALAFDKTGTLTRGQPRLTDLQSADGVEARELLAAAAAVEAASGHPLAGAVLDAAERQKIALRRVRDLHVLPGRGVEATLDDRRIFVGRPDGSRQAPPDFTRLEAEGKTAVVVRADGRTLGLLAISDESRPQASAALQALDNLGVEHMVMLTGDNDRVAAAVARRIGLSEWRAALLPEQKTAALAELQQAYGRVAMVGDGVNDAPALASAQVGIAMGAAASDVALETADVALMSGDLMKLPLAIRLARRALAVIRQNIALSLATVAALVPLALFGGLSLTGGLLLNEGAALLIMANSLRLLGGLDERTASSAPPDLGGPSQKAS